MTDWRKTALEKEIVSGYAKPDVNLNKKLGEWATGKYATNPAEAQMLVRLLAKAELKSEEKAKMNIEFTRGMLAMIFFNSLFQDLVGRDYMIEMFQNHWLDSRITVPAAILGLAVLFLFNKDWSKTKPVSEKTE
jgi:hypothetical protein